MNEQYKKEGFDFLTSSAPKELLAANAAAAVLYFLCIALWFPRGNPLLFSLLIAGEVFHIWQILSYCWTVWNVSERSEMRFDDDFLPHVDVFITVAGEPADVVRKTITAARAMDWPGAAVWVLNDGFVAGKENWREIEALAADLGVNCITRTRPGGAKAGNINNALKKTSAQFVAIFDADHAPHSDFLRRTMGYFADWRMAFVQTPQYYANHAASDVASGAWEQQQLFFGPICRGKSRLNSAFMCGTNMVVRRGAIERVGGMMEQNIAEDFLTSLFIHQMGWRSHYVPQVLAEGLAPEDLRSYTRQQFRWARGSLELIFKYNPLFARGLTWTQKFQYLTSASYWLSGAVVVMNAVFPLIFFFTGAVPLAVSTMALALAFLPYIFLTVANLRLSSNASYTFRALVFSMSGFAVQLQALAATILGKRSMFEVTSKRRLTGSHTSLVIPHLAYIALAIAGFATAFFREGFTASVAANAAWAFFNVAIFFPYALTALPLPSPSFARLFRRQSSGAAAAEA